MQCFFHRIKYQPFDLLTTLAWIIGVASKETWVIYDLLNMKFNKLSIAAWLHYKIRIYCSDKRTTIYFVCYNARPALPSVHYTSFLANHVHTLPYTVPLVNIPVQLRWVCFVTLSNRLSFHYCWKWDCVLLPVIDICPINHSSSLGC